MSDPYVGEIRMFGGNFAPVGWLFCNGQLLSIAENEVLFALLGTTYGGDGVSNFALPNLQGRIPLHTSSKYPMGQAAGTETVTLQTAQIPAHTHQAVALTGEANLSDPSGNLWAAPVGNYYSTTPPADLLAPLNTSSLLIQGGSQPHDNMQPFLAVSFIIATQGIYPSQG